MSLPNEDYRPRPLNGCAPMTASSEGMTPTIRRTPALRSRHYMACQAVLSVMHACSRFPSACIARPIKSRVKKTLEEWTLSCQCILRVCSEVQVYEGIDTLIYFRHDGAIPHNRPGCSKSDYVCMCQYVRSCRPQPSFLCAGKWRRRRPRT
jgi:hypothetical protein